eukprot:Nk52_evm21s2531 gene=Nk52_evmTU21s2531
MSTLNDVEAQLAALQARVEATEADINQFFLVVMGIFVFLMQTGFGMLEAGSCHSKNVTNILCKNFLDPCVAAVAFWFFGYAFVAGDGKFIGSHHFFLENFPEDEYTSWFFQFVFAATATTIVSGAMAERTQFVAYLCYSFFITGFMYPVVAHWGWSSEGWLYTRGFMDFAGSSIVHCTGGAAALMGAVTIGPRIGRFNERGEPQDMPGHSTVLSCLGGLLLWTGFFAFNGGSELGIFGGSASQVGLVITNTTLAAAGGALTVLVAMFWQVRKWSLLSAINGSLAGMVSICSGCNVVEPYGAFIIGIVAGVTYICWSAMLVRLRIDDVIDAAPVHLGAGMWGTIATPLFAHNSILDNNGVLYEWNREAFKMLGYNIAGTVTITAWAAVLSGVFFFVLKKLNYLRITEELELEGMDQKKHGEPAYPVRAYSRNFSGSDLGVKEGSAVAPAKRSPSSDIEEAHINY